MKQWYLWNIALQPLVGCYNVWANLRCSSSILLGVKRDYSTNFYTSKTEVNMSFCYNFNIAIPVLAEYSGWCRIDIDLPQFSHLSDGIPLPKRRQLFHVGSISHFHIDNVQLDMPFWYQFDITISILIW